jgi:hypothetical protein
MPIGKLPERFPQSSRLSHEFWGLFFLLLTSQLIASLAMAANPVSHSQRNNITFKKGDILFVRVGVTKEWDTSMTDAGKQAYSSRRWCI